MANMTISTDEETLRRARVEAAKRNLSVSRFVGEVLKEKFGEDDAYERAMNLETAVDRLCQRARF